MNKDLIKKASLATLAVACLGGGIYFGSTLNNSSANQTITLEDVQQQKEEEIKGKLQNMSFNVSIMSDIFEKLSNLKDENAEKPSQETLDNYTWYMGFYAQQPQYISDNLDKLSTAEDGFALLSELYTKFEYDVPFTITDGNLTWNRVVPVPKGAEEIIQTVSEKADDKAEELIKNKNSSNNTNVEINVDVDQQLVDDERVLNEE